ncbi:unnamed protein product [Rotaria sp. Silwood2]|nr:unnamed protein product [Rotaria sp. Silwood2]CAF2936059.1 unnamed protein product [Rotaria sp. Silwood2]CAF3314348.1 unnamed protein product [Rotaria sp. Silwood2]CAF3903061.1 unnamed protein product [Rotaria sp. Silwood2]CAF3989773.1 unnamed protein product [Rotaria sp. Silwood2]
MNVDLVTANDTELALFQRLSRRENVFISTDELDAMNTRFGVYLASNMGNDSKTIGSKLLCQCYDSVKNLSRTTGSSSFNIERGSVNIFGASTGNMLAPIFRQYHSNTMSDGTVSRYIYIGASAHKTMNNTPTGVLSVQPNIVHILIVIRLLAEYKPIFVFTQHEEENKIPTTGFLVPQDIAEARQNIIDPIPTTEKMLLLKPSVTIPAADKDDEDVGSLLSSRDAMRRIIDSEHKKSLQTDVNGNSLYTPLQRAFQRKSSNKLARIAGICQALSYAFKLCTECVNQVRFGDGLFLKESIDYEQLDWLNRFYVKVKELIAGDIRRAPKYGIDQRPLFNIEKAAVQASEHLFQYASTTISILFEDSPISANREHQSNEHNFCKTGGLFHV